MGRRPIEKLDELIRDRRANVAVMTGLLALPLFGMSGLAIDYAFATAVKAKLDVALDAAALAAIKATADNIQTGGTPANAIALGKQSAQKAFSANSSGAVALIDTNVAINGNIVSSTTSYTSSVNFAFGQIFGVATGKLHGAVSATMSLPSYIDVFIMVDTSGSMSIGASSADQQALIGQIGCAFACHDGNPVKGYSDAYTYAEQTGISLRYDVVIKGIKQFMDSVDATDPGHQYIKTAIYTFDSNLNNPTPLTSDTSAVRQGLPAAPSTAGNYDGATHFNEAIPTVSAAIGTGGDGMSPNNPKKLLIIATDGVEDPNRTWITDVSLRPQVQVIDTSFCNTLLGHNVSVSFIHTPYLPMSWDWGYMATLGQPASSNSSLTRVDMVQPALRACAGSLYSLANDTTSLTNAFTQVFQTYIGSRLTL